MLTHAAAHPELIANVGNIALLQRAQACGLLPAPVGNDAAQAYRVLRQIQHKARLDEAPTQVAMETVTAQRRAGMALWTTVFGTPAAP